MKNRYNPYEWKAEIYKTPQEIYSALDSFGIYGKDIDSITIKHYMTAMAPCLVPVMADGPKAVMHYFDY